MNPSATFSEADLQHLDERVVKQLTEERVLQPLPTDVDAASFHGPDGRHLALFEDDDGVWAFDDEDVEFEPLPVDITTLRRWRFDLVECAKSIANRNELDGTPTALTPRLAFVGERTESNEHAILLALLHERDDVVLEVSRVPTMLPARYERYTVLLPSPVWHPTDEVFLESQKISLALLHDDLSFESAHSSPTDTALPFWHAENYRSVRLGSHEWTLSVGQAEVVRVLDRSRLRGSPDVLWSDVTSALGSLQRHPDSMRDVFRTVDDWQDLIASRSRGTYRLNL